NDEIIAISGVDIVDQMTAEYRCGQKTDRWPNVIAIELFDFVCIHSYIMLCLKLPDWMKNSKSRRRLWNEQLAEEMVIPQILARSWQGLQSTVTAEMKLFGAKPPEKL
ncbi:unnamed protein product, partial [Allacma fusca]